MNFEQWLAGLFGQKQSEIEKVLKDETALHFLMAWSLFEAKCFGGFLKSCCLEGFARRMIAESFDHAKISGAAHHFFARYQDASLLTTLLQKDTKALRPRMTAVLATPFDDLQPEDTVFLVAAVATRFRNNIFHGTKGLPSWPKYKEQIAHCTGAMQSFVTHAESVKPTLK
jgi:hypothetical protein